jgi:hypothetical protein
MKTHEISFNSHADLKRQISAFKEQHPRATFDETQIKRACASAIKMDNDGKRVGKRISFKINYTETPL